MQSQDSDEIPIGAERKRWLPGSLLKDPWAGRNLPAWFQAFQFLVVFGGLIGAIACGKIASQFVFRPIGLNNGLLWGGAVFGVTFSCLMIALHRLGQVTIDRKVLAIHEHGVRWGNQTVLFADIHSISMGTETFREKYFPTINKIYKSHWRHGKRVKAAEDLERSTTLAFHLIDGEVQQWRKLGLCFGPDSLEQFFSSFNERSNARIDVDKSNSRG